MTTETVRTKTLPLWAKLTIGAVVLVLLIPIFLIFISGTNNVTTEPADQSSGLLTWLMIGGLVFLSGFFLSKELGKGIPKTVLLLLGIAIIAFTLLNSGFGTAVKRNVEMAENCVVDNNCPQYTARPNTRSTGLLQPITLNPGEQSVPIGDFTGTHLTWDLIEGTQKPVVYSRIGNEGPFVPGCLPGAWWVLFVNNTNETTTMQVERHQGRNQGQTLPCT